jgi:hypothetical protein
MRDLRELNAGLGVLVLAGMALVGCGSSSGGPDMPATGNQDAGNTVGGIAFPPTDNMYVNMRGCPGCHQGPDPQKTGFMSGAPQPVPGNFGEGVVLYGPNLTPDPTTGVGNWNDDQLTTAILSGIDNMGERLCPQMAHFPDMQPAEVTSILGYLHSLTPVMNTAPASHCPPLKP